MNKKELVKEIVKYYSKYYVVAERLLQLQQENERLKEIEKEHKNCTRKHWQQKCSEHCANEMLYKSRIDKAIEILKLCNSVCAKETIEILEGEINE